MKKTIITLLIVVFQLLSCKGQDFKKNITGNWEQEFYNASIGEVYYQGEIWTFYSDGTCQIDYGLASGHRISKFKYDITYNDCSKNPVKEKTQYFLNLTVISGEETGYCFSITEINTAKDSEGKILMLLYVYGANGGSVFVKRP